MYQQNIFAGMNKKICFYPVVYVAIKRHHFLGMLFRLSVERFAPGRNRGIENE